jgi:glycosyltransferase A (GT-A) superfamily protein (DUF2064 family)
VAGKVKTRLTPPLDPEEACRLYAAFLADMDRLAERLADADSTIFLVRDPDVAACERLLPSWRHAWQSQGNLDLHRIGSPAVIVGSDHPDLPPALVRGAFRALARHDLVLGPTPDGGYYLIGTRRPLPGLLLQDIEWSSPRTAEQTERRGLALGLAAIRLDSWPDVDTWQDAVALGRRLVVGSGDAPATGRVLRTLLEKYQGF